MKNKILAIGPVTKDYIITPTDNYSQIGGAVYYQTMTLTQLKKDVVSIISIGKNDVEILDELLKNQIIIPQETTQEYTNIYDEQFHRQQKATMPSNTITPEDIKISLSPVKYALISPLSPNDIPPETIEYLKKNDITTVLTAQGYLRKTDGKNNVTERKWNNKREYLKYTDILFLDKKEAKLAFQIDDIEEETIQKIIKEYNLKQIIITLAENGSRIYTKDKTYTIAAIKTKKMVDATGLGDTYIAAYVAKFEETRDIYRSGLFASIAAKEKLENQGPLKSSKEKIEEELDKYG